MYHEVSFTVYQQLHDAMTATVIPLLLKIVLKKRAMVIITDIPLLILIRINHSDTKVVHMNGYNLNIHKSIDSWRASFWWSRDWVRPCHMWPATSRTPYYRLALVRLGWIGIHIFKILLLKLEYLYQLDAKKNWMFVLCV